MLVHYHHCSVAAQAVPVLRRQALKFVWVEGCYVKILHDQWLLDVLFKDRHCFVDGLWSLLAMSSSMLFFMHVDRA